MTPDAAAFARDWIESFNGRDLDQILAHYADDVRLTSAIAKRVTGSAEVKGKAALGAYFATALARRPDLKFDLRRVYVGVDSIVIEYDALDGKVASEFMQFNPDGLVQRVAAHYA